MTMSADTRQPLLAIVFAAPVPYGAALQWQAALVSARQAGRVPDVLLVLEHTPVITCGVRARAAHILAAPARLAELGIELHSTPRGGDVTYHGPGQWVLYPILKLTGADADAHAFVSSLEEAAIRTAGDFGVAATRRAGKTGVWTDSGKIAAIGVRFQKWVSSHGMSFNAAPDLSHFDLIVPCGLAGERVTSLRALLGSACPSRDAVRDALLRHFATVFGREVEVVMNGTPDMPDAVTRLLKTTANPSTGDRHVRALAVAGRFRSGHRNLSVQHDAEFAKTSRR